MTKIEEFKAASSVAKQIATAVACTLGRDDSRNDKATFRCTFDELGKGDWSPMKFWIYASHGYYGSSSGYSDTSEELGKYVALAIQKHRIEILDTAASLAAADAEKARKAAEDEARNVLQETTP